MTDLSKTIAPRSDQLNAEDLLVGPRTVTITRVDGNDSADQPVSIHFEGDNGRPFKPSKTVRRVLVKVWGPNGNDYIGRRMTLYCDPDVQFGGIKVGGIRISHMSHIDKPVSMMLTKARGKKAEVTIQPLGETPDADVLAQAKGAARQGKDAYTQFYNSDLGKQHRSLLKEHAADLKALVEDAEEASKPLSQRLQGDTPDEPTAAPEASDSPKATKAFLEGIEAHAAGKQDTDCPYDADPEKGEWLNGWFQAEEGKSE